MRALADDTADMLLLFDDAPPSDEDRAAGAEMHGHMRRRMAGVDDVRRHCERVNAGGPVTRAVEFGEVRAAKIAVYEAIAKAAAGG